MNERIRELVEQAELYAVSDNSSMLFDVWKKRYTEKFAELIVRECCKEITQEPFNAGAASLWLKDYFGVEE